MPAHIILGATNAPLTVTNLAGMSTLTPGGQSTIESLIFGTVGASATGELGLKVIVAGSSGTASSNVAVTTQVGAANQATGQVTGAAVAGTLVAARATRRSVTIKNTDASLAVFVGPATVTAGNGMQLKAGESISVDTTALIQVIAPSGSPVVAFYETFD